MDSGAWVTGDGDSIEKLKNESAGYYSDWVAVHACITANQIDEAQKKYEALVGKPAFQHFLGKVKEAVRVAQAKQMLAKLIGMIVITIVSMGVGTIVEGLVGGATVVAGAVEGGEAVGAVTTGLGWGKNATAVAGFVAETTTFSLASNLLLTKDHSAAAIVSEFGKNIIMFGALRGVGKLFEASGVGQIIAAKGGATTAKMAEGVAMGGAGVFAGYAQARIEALMTGRSLTPEQVHDTIMMGLVQAIAMVVVGRLAESSLRRMKIKAAYRGTKLANASSLADHLESIAAPLQGAKKVSDLQIHDLINKDLEQLTAEKAAFEQVRERMKAANEPENKGPLKDVNDHIASLDQFANASSATKSMVGLESDVPNHFKAAADEIPNLMAQHLAAKGKWEEVPTKEGEPKTYKVTTASGEKIYISEKTSTAADVAQRYGVSSNPAHLKAFEAMHTKNAGATERWARAMKDAPGLADSLLGRYGENASVEVKVGPDGRLDIHGELDITAEKLKAIESGDLGRLVDVCKAKGPTGDDYAYFEATAGKNYRLRFRSRIEANASAVVADVLAQLKIAATDPRAAVFTKMSADEQVRLWDLKNENTFKNKEMFKQAADWALSKSPKDARQFVADVQFYGAEVEQRTKAATDAFNADVHAQLAKSPGTPEAEIRQKLAQAKFSKPISNEAKIRAAIRDQVIQQLGARVTTATGKRPPGHRQQTRRSNGI